MTRLPVRVTRFDRGARAGWAYPLVGVVVGGLAVIGGATGIWIGLPDQINALISLIFLVVLTGAMHEDGLADCADGLWGGWNPAHRLEIMKDSHIGAYGAIAIFFGLSARWAALWSLYSAGFAVAAPAILAAAVLSRAAMPALMAGLPHARQSGLSHSTGPCPPRTAALAAAVASVLAMGLLGTAGLAAATAAGLSAWTLALIARAKIGGQTGDILGATQQITEITVLFLLVA